MVISEIIFAFLSIQFFFFEAQNLHGLLHTWRVEIEVDQANLSRLREKADVIVHLGRVLWRTFKYECRQIGLLECISANVPVAGRLVFLTNARRLLCHIFISYRFI